MKKKVKLLLTFLAFSGLVGGILPYTIEEAEAEVTSYNTDYKDGKCEGEGTACLILVWN